MISISRLKQIRTKHGPIGANNGCLRMNPLHDTLTSLCFCQRMNTEIHRHELFVQRLLICLVRTLQIDPNRIPMIFFMLPSSSYASALSGLKTTSTFGVYTKISTRRGKLHCSTHIQTHSMCLDRCLPT